jgi:hypothetical protein
MTWIKTVSMDDDESVKNAMLEQRKLYPVEYLTPVATVDHGMEAGIVASHSLIPDAMFPELPLTRRQHEMITTLVSVTNRCHY